MMRDGCFNVSHWIFAYEYYSSAVSMPFIFTREEMPERKRECMKWLFYVMFGLNIFDPLVYYLILFYGNWVSVETTVSPLNQPGWDFTYQFTHYMVGGLQVASGFFLLVAVYMIRKFLVEQGMKNQVNYHSMSLHAFSFTLYNASVIAFYVSYYIYFKRLTALGPDVKPDNPQLIQYTNTALKWWILTTYTTFIAQMCLIWIFYGFRHKEEEEKHERAQTRVEMEGEDDIDRMACLDCDKEFVASKDAAKTRTDSFKTEDLENDLEDELCTSRSSTIHSEVEVEDVSDNAVSLLDQSKADTSFQGTIM